MHSLLNHRFRSIEEFSATARAWDVDFVQLDCGRLDAILQQYIGESSQFARGQFNRSIQQAGSTPKGLRTFAVPAESSSPFLWRGRNITQLELMVFPRDNELDAVSGPGFHVHTMSFSEELLHGIADSIQLPRIRDLLDGASVATCDPSAMDALRGALGRFAQRLAGRNSGNGDAALEIELESNIVFLLLQALASSRGTVEDPTPRLRGLAVRRAEEYILNFAGAPLTVPELCRAAGVSERTLQNAFMERLGVSPKAYLKSFRLHRAHANLENADPRSTKVSDVAKRWGFWHMGQFAVDYRKQFGEKPSQTLNRPRSGSRSATPSAPPASAST